MTELSHPPGIPACDTVGEMLARAKGFIFPFKVFLKALRVMAEEERSLLRLYGGAAVAVVRWAIKPTSYTVAHLFMTEDRPTFGYKWVHDSEDRAVCTSCHAGHPVDFMNFAAGLLRWDPGAAHAEALSLIARGDMKDTKENQSRWANIPEGCMIAWTSPPPTDSSLPMITALNYEGRYYTTCMSHLLDLSDSQFAKFSSWLEDTMPEWDICRQGINMTATYAPDNDMMAGINPYLFVNQSNQPGATPSQQEILVPEEDD